MTFHRSEQLTGSLNPVSPRKVLPSKFSLSKASSEYVPQARRSSQHNSRPERRLARLGLKLALAMCLMAFALSPQRPALFAQPPSVEMPAADGEAITPNAPSDIEFDIDLGTEEFENFGEEGFQVEEENYVRDTVVPTVIKVAIAAVLILLLAWLAMKLIKPKPPAAPE